MPHSEPKFGMALHLYYKNFTFGILTITFGTYRLGYTLQVLTGNVYLFLGRAGFGLTALNAFGAVPYDVAYLLIRHHFSLCISMSNVVWRGVRLTS